MVYRATLQDVQTLYHNGFTKFIDSKRYLKARKKYLEIAASFPNKRLDARVNALLSILPKSINRDKNGNWSKLEMENKERSPRKEKKKKKKPK